MNDLIKFLTVVLIVMFCVAAALTITFYGDYRTLPGMVP